MNKALPCCRFELMTSCARKLVEEVFRGTLQPGDGFEVMLMIDYATVGGQPAPMPAGGAIPCPALIRQDSTGCLDVLSLSLKSLMNGIILPTTFLSPVRTRENIHKIGFYKFPNVKDECSVQDAIDADIMKASVG